MTLVRLAAQLTFNPVLADPCTATSRRNITEDVNDSQSIAGGVEEHPIPVIVCVPTCSVLRRRLLLLCELVLGAEVDDERVAIIPFTDRINLVFATADLNDLVPGLGGELFGRDLAVARKVQVFGVPSAFIILIVIDSDSQILHPPVDVLLLDGTGNAKPPLSEEMLGILGGEVLVVLVQVVKGFQGLVRCSSPCFRLRC